MHRQKRNLPSVPSTTNNYLQLRRTNSESCFSRKTSTISTPMSNDDDSDLLEIDLNNPIDSINRTYRSKTESELSNHNIDIIYSQQSLNQLSLPKIQLRDQTTNTPSISNLNLITKTKTKKKNSLSFKDKSTSMISNDLSSTLTNSHSILLHSSPMYFQKLQKVFCMIFFWFNRIHLFFIEYKY